MKVLGEVFSTAKWADIDESRVIHQKPKDLVDFIFFFSININILVITPPFLSFWDDPCGII